MLLVPLLPLPPPLLLDLLHGRSGAVAIEIEVVTAVTDVHSGLAGGAVQNPARALAQLLATMWHPGNNSIAVAGWYDRVRAVTDADRCGGGGRGARRCLGWQHGRVPWHQTCVRPRHVGTLSQSSAWGVARALHFHFPLSPPVFLRFSLPFLQGRHPCLQL